MRKLFYQLSFIHFLFYFDSISIQLDYLLYLMASRFEGSPEYQFVTVKDQKLWLHGKPFMFLGASCYYLMSYAADEKGVRRVANDTLQAAQSMGLTVLRTWAFSDGHRWNSLQPEPGVFVEDVLKGLIGQYTIVDLKESAWFFVLQIIGEAMVE
eukprot:TRINITY_DN26392_c0_g1_i2.p2 TRINITY_DN26392_c0_g1~~TRINITY_DN26392_c0_g1_i2.p2  ORF type:complete len:175 (-),score=16.10 TRINITY_DN26392_c0_g1_i2:408-869(-)